MGRGGRTREKESPEGVPDIRRVTGQRESHLRPMDMRYGVAVAVADGGGGGYCLIAIRGLCGIPTMYSNLHRRRGPSRRPPAALVDAVAGDAVVLRPVRRGLAA